MKLSKYLLFSVLCVMIMSTFAQAGPKIFLPETEFNWGKICQNRTVNHTFWIKSVGDDTLIITKVVPGCGCTKAPLQDSVLAPGDSTRLDIFFSTKSYRGYVTKKPYLLTNIGEEITYLKIYSLLVAEPENDLPLYLNPQYIDVSQYTEKPRRKASFLIENRGDIDYKLTLIDWERDFFDVDLPSLVKAGETVEGSIMVHEDKVPYDFNLSLTFAINDIDETRYTLPIERKVRVKKGAAANN
ncbi:MAG: DUF1573 domain-containing protein [bacterium]